MRSPHYILAIILYLLVTSAYGQTTSREFLDRANERSKSGHPDAESDYSRAIELNPEFADAYIGRGEFFLRNQKFDPAIADFSKAIELDPISYKAYSGRAFGFGRIARYDESISDATKAIQIDPTIAIAYSTRGLAYYGKRDAKAALADLSRAIDLGMTTASAYYNRGLARDAVDDWLGGIVDTTKAIEMEPQNPKFYSGRAVARRSYGDYLGAIADYTKVLEFEPENRYMILGRMWSKLFNADHSGAHQDAVKFLEMNTLAAPESTFTIAAAYISLRKMGKTDAARIFLAESLKAQKTESFSVDILRFLNGNLTDKQLLDLAKNDPYLLTDAHSFIGVKSVLDGDKKTATIHFEWDKKNGSHTRISHQLARTEYARF